MGRASFPGTCRFCDEHFPKAGVSRHLSACPRRVKGNRDVFHLVVEVPRTPYWLHAEADAESTLAVLDQFLRKTWLECCGHLSDFTIDGIRYSDGENSDSMDTPLQELLAIGKKCTHRYDFGSTTELSIRVIARETGGPGRSQIRLLARNDLPAAACRECGQPSTRICAQCVYDGDAAFCKTCAKKHACGEDVLLPLVNSPRAGVCGYGG